MPGIDEDAGVARARGRMRRGPGGRVVLAFGLLVMAFVQGAPPTAAHGDARLIDGRMVLAPGESVSFEGSVHYHRLVGRIAADGPVRVRLVEFVTRAVVFETSPAERLAFNRLIRCCRDDVWSPYTLVIDNPGDRPITLRARVVLVHDDLAVMVDGAESGTTEGSVLIAAVWIGILWWGGRRRRPIMALRRPITVLACLVAGIGGLALYGWARYGVGGVPGLVAGLSHVPALPWNPVVSRASLLLGVALVAWILTGAMWSRAAPVPPGPWLALGGLLATGIATVAVLIVSEYGLSPMPVGMAVGMIIPLLLVLASRSRAPAPAPIAAGR
jgi:hypothetical protein